MNCLLDRDDVVDRLSEIHQPALVIHGSRDTAIGFDRAELLSRRLGDSRGLIRVDGAAHAANLTHPAIVNPPLRAFLDALP